MSFNTIPYYDINTKNQFILFSQFWIMLEAKENFLDRVEQSFILFKENIIPLSIPYIVFNIISIVLLPLIFTTIIGNFISLDQLTWGEWQNLGIIIPLWVSIAIIFGLIYIVTLIPIQIGLFTGIKQAIYWETITPKENILYGFSHLSELIFKTYWYIFAYVLLIPSIIFITWGLSMIFWLSQNRNFAWFFSIIGYILISISIIVGIIFMIYRGLRVKFAIITAVHKNNYSKENFEYSLKISQNKWWRIFWNLFWIWILGSLAIWIISQLIDALTSLGWNNFSYLSLLWNSKNISPDDVKVILDSMMQFSFMNFVNSIFQNILATLLAIFIMIFTYILFLRLSDDLWNNQLKIKKELSEEL